LEKARKKEKREALRFAALAFLLMKALGVKKIKKPQDLIHFFLTSLPEDPNKDKDLLTQAKAALERHRRIHGRSNGR
jgi:hypothetical protein